MACVITYKNNKYSQQEFEKYFKNNFNEFVNEFLSQDIEGFRDFVNENQTIEENEVEESPFFDMESDFNPLSENLDISQEDVALENKFQELLNKGVISQICN